MSMLRHLDRRDALKDVVHLHSRPRRGRRHLRRPAARRRPSLRRLPPAPPAHRRPRPDGPGSLDELCPDWREREAFCSGPGELLDALTEHWEQHGDPERMHLERFQPVIGGEGEGEGGTIKFCKTDLEAEADGGTRSSSPARRPGRPPLRLPDGHLPHLRRAASLGRGPRPAYRRAFGEERRDGPHLRERARGRGRDRALNTDTEETSMTDHRRSNEPARAHLSEEQIDELAKEFDAIHDEVYGDLGDRDRRYITAMIDLHRRLAVMSRVLLLGAQYRRWVGRGRRPTRPPRSSRTWRSATTSCTASGTG